jgi:hypothetical protein
VYHTALTYKINDNYSTKGYYLDAPQSHSLYGGKLTTNHQMAEITIGSLIHYMQTSEDVAATADGKMLELQLSASTDGYYGALGYVKTGKENGWGSADNLGDIVVWFEEGNNMYYTDAQTTYLYLSKTIGEIKFSGIYGTTSYRHAQNTQELRSSELDIWASHSYNNNFSIALGYSTTNEDDAETWTTDMNQLNAKVSYKF